MSLIVFRRLVALVVREYAAHQLRKLPAEVTAEEMIVYVGNINCRVHFIVNVFQILFGEPPINIEVRRHVKWWFQQPSSLIGVR